jgi:hypothetical protein
MSLRHAHSRQDEFVYVLQGTPTLYTDEGPTPLEPGMCAGFKAATGNGHHLVNETADDVVCLDIGDRTPGYGQLSRRRPDGHIGERQLAFRAQGRIALLEVVKGRARRIRAYLADLQSIPERVPSLIVAKASVRLRNFFSVPPV